MNILLVVFFFLFCVVLFVGVGLVCVVEGCIVFFGVVFELICVVDIGCMSIVEVSFVGVIYGCVVFFVVVDVWVIL